MKRNRSCTYSDENPIYFVTTTVTEKLPIFFDDKLCNFVLEELNFYRDKLNFAIYAYVIMPTHIHLLLQQLGYRNISDFMRDFKAHSAKQIVRYFKNQVKAGALTLTIPSSRESQSPSSDLLLEKAFNVPTRFPDLTTRKILETFELSAIKYKKKSKHQVWQERFDDVLIWSEKMFNIKFDYIHNNPTEEPWNLVSEPQDYKYSSARNYYLDDDSVFKIDRIEI